jgi:hypothetical protein
MDIRQTEQDMAWFPLSGYNRYADGIIIRKGIYPGINTAGM